MVLLGKAETLKFCGSTGNVIGYDRGHYVLYLHFYVSFLEIQVMFAENVGVNRNHNKRFSTNAK